MNGSHKRGHGQDHRHSRHDSHDGPDEGLFSEAGETKGPEAEAKEHSHGLRERRPAGGDEAS